LFEEEKIPEKKKSFYLGCVPELDHRSSTKPSFMTKKKPTFVAFFKQFIHLPQKKLYMVEEEKFNRS